MLGHTGQFVLVAINTHLPDKIHLDNAHTFEYTI